MRDLIFGVNIFAGTDRYFECRDNDIIQVSIMYSDLIMPIKYM